MKITTLIAGGIAVVALLLVPISGALAQGPHGSGECLSGDQAGFGSGSGQGRGFGRGFGRMIKALDLTDEQLTQFKQLQNNRTEDGSDTRKQMKDLHLELQQLWSEDSPDKHAILAKMEELDGFRKQRQEEMVDFRLQMLEILTPEQRDKLNEMKANAPGHGRGWGRGKGRGQGGHGYRGGRGWSSEDQSQEQ